MTSRRIKAQPRKTPQQARATATVEAILASAAETFGRDGFARANINVIAERAGVSVGSLYQYFPSKEAVLVALIKQHTDEVLSKLEAVLGDVAGLPIDLAVRRVVTAMIAAHSAPFHRMLTRELDELGRLDSIQSTIDARHRRGPLVPRGASRRDRRARSRARRVHPRAHGRSLDPRRRHRSPFGPRRRRPRHRALGARPRLSRRRTGTAIAVIRRLRGVARAVSR